MRRARSRPTACRRDHAGLLQLKKMGFSDARLAKLSGMKAKEVFVLRHKVDVRPVYKRIDTCAAEFASQTSYMYSCYEGTGWTGNDWDKAECEANPSDRAQGHHPRRRTQPHRPGHRVRLLLRPRRLRFARGRHRDHHGQLQSGDGLDRLRHLRPALFRAADRRGRDRAGARRAAQWHPARRHRAVRRPDPAEAGRRARGSGDPDPRHLARRHRPRRRPRAVPAVAA